MLLGLLSRRNIQHLEDDELIEMLRKGNSRALGELFQRYSTLVLGLCIKYMKDPQVAEDLMMDIFEKLTSKIEASDLRNFKSWLYSVSRNECLMELRRKKLDTSSLENTIQFAENDDDSRLEEKLQQEKEITALEDAISNLKEEQQTCITLFYLKQKSYDEIVQISGYPLKKVKSYIQNGKRNLKINLEKTGEFEK